MNNLTQILSTLSQSNFKELLSHEFFSQLAQQPFLDSYLGDTLRGLSTNNNDEQISTLLNVLKERLIYLKHWEIEGNQTIDLLTNNVVLPNEMKPHIRFSEKDYETYYKKQNEEIGARINKHNKPLNKFKRFEPLKFRRNYDHIIRKSHALNVIETFMGLLDHMEIDINHKWLDIGCGNGLISNAVDSKKHSTSEWQIDGCDLQENKIIIANKRACRKRKYHQQNVLTQLSTDNNGDSYDIISMFEFCEHFIDPVKLLKEITKKDFKAMVIATPLSQKINQSTDKTPDPVHLWSFSAEAFNKIINHLGLITVYQSEITVGTHTQGLDWLTLVAVKKEVYPLFNKF